MFADLSLAIRITVLCKMMSEKRAIWYKACKALLVHKKMNKKYITEGWRGESVPCHLDNEKNLAFIDWQIAQAQLDKAIP